MTAQIKQKECYYCLHFNTNISYHFDNGKCELTQKPTSGKLTCSKYKYFREQKTEVAK